jgi:hypothetical protein
MITRQQGDEIILAALRQVKGLTEVVPLADADRQTIRDIEAEAEAKSLLGLGKVINAGVQEILKCDWLYVGLTNLEFDWACHSNLLMKKGDQIVGEEVRNQETIDRLSTCENVWFLHKNFVVYKDRVTFPQDVMKKICYFEIPCHPANWPVDLQCHAILYCSPSTPCDVFLKNQYFQGVDSRGSGTILIGVKL